MPKPELLLPLPGPVSTSNSPCSLSAWAMRSFMMRCLMAMRSAWRWGSTFFIGLPHGDENGCTINVGGDQTLVVETFQRLRYEHLLCRPPAGLAIGVEQQQMIAPARRQIEIMQAHYHRPACRRLLGQQRHHRALMVQVKVVGRLVGKPYLWRLGQHRGNRQALAFA